VSLICSWTGFSTQTWDWNFGLECETGFPWNWNVGLEHGTRMWHWTGLTKRGEGGSTLALVGQNIVVVLYPILVWKMNWNGGMDYRKNYLQM